jgi:alanine racemase
MNKGYPIKEIATACGGKLHAGAGEEVIIQHLLLDSRKLQQVGSSLFFALPGSRQDGHQFIDDLVEKGITNFVITKTEWIEKYPKVNFIVVKDTIAALQKLAGFHRKRFSYPVIGITGSNGKTIIKEWLYQLLNEDYNIVRSPKSFNSQIGVPLSLWQMGPENDLAIIEAGISESGEMGKLEKIILPTIGIIANIGEAHNDGFLNLKHKAKEKLTLFTKSDRLIYSKDHAEINQALTEINALKGIDAIPVFTWSQHSDADVRVTSILQQNNHSYISAIYKGQEFDFEIPFADKASVENAIHCACVLLLLGKDFSVLRTRMRLLTRIAMRLEMRDAINNCSLINDSYNSDFESLRIAIDFLRQQNQHPKKTIILSDILQSGRSELDLYTEVAKLLKQNNIYRLIGIGPSITRERRAFEQSGLTELICFDSTEQLLRELDTSTLHDEVILLKGARQFEFEKIAKLLEKKAHQTVLEINLNAVVNNLKVYQSLLEPETNLMAMVKAFSYGSGSYEIANVLQFNRVNYLAVAYADEGVELRKNGITLPIMVMNPEERSFEAMITHNLEPDVYSLSLLEKFVAILKLKRKSSSQKYRIHVELETGMNRLGFEQSDIRALIDSIKSSGIIEIASIFSHLAASEAPEYDQFTKGQIALFEQMSSSIIAEFDYKILRHILNSSGISRHTYAQYDMVRLGIGLYGLDPTPAVQAKLHPVSSLKTTISQIKHVKAGDTVGYGRVGKVEKDKTIATVGIGYADGLNRKLSNGNGHMLVGTHMAPIIGNVCMDMTMIDITGIEAAREGDEVVVFGTNPPVETIAKAAGTIAYEILTGISARVKRVYFQE